MTASVSGRIPHLTLRPPNLEQGASAVAHMLLHGAEGLAPDNNSSYACLFLVAHATECALKAILARSGLTEKRLRAPGLAHNIESLWSLAVAEWPAIGEIPDWAAILSTLHDGPYHLRYLSKVHGISTPNARTATDGLKYLVEQMDIALRAIPMPQP